MAEHGAPTHTIANRRGSSCTAGRGVSSPARVRTKKRTRSVAFAARLAHKLGSETRGLALWMRAGRTIRSGQAEPTGKGGGPTSRPTRRAAVERREVRTAGCIRAARRSGFRLSGLRGEWFVRSPVSACLRCILVVAWASPDAINSSWLDGRVTPF